MILIISQKEDHNTSEVIQWLNYFGVKYIRINRGDTLTIQKLYINNISNPDIIITSRVHGEINVMNIRGVWYRRGEIHFYLPSLVFVKNIELKMQMIKHLRHENLILEEYLEYIFKLIPHIGTYELRGVNKLVVLNEAQKVGLEIPNTIVVSAKNELMNTDDIITKSISESFTPKTQFGEFMTYTEKVNIDRIQPFFFPSLFQDLIKKEADLRIFYLNKKIYCMAIQSQAHPQTKIDFRKYLMRNPNRHISFKLPQNIEMKLVTLMERIGLQTASIDMVFTEQGRFIFLEANPIGQFGMTSKPCNYFLDREIALSLFKFSNQ